MFHYKIYLFLEAKAITTSALHIMYETGFVEN
jgi:hypothetical protein